MRIWNLFSLYVFFFLFILLPSCTIDWKGKKGCCYLLNCVGCWCCERANVRCLRVVFLFCISFSLDFRSWYKRRADRKTVGFHSPSRSHPIAWKHSILLSEFSWQTVADKMFSLPSYQLPVSMLAKLRYVEAIFNNNVFNSLACLTHEFIFLILCIRSMMKHNVSCLWWCQWLFVWLINNTFSNGSISTI